MAGAPTMLEGIAKTSHDFRVLMSDAEKEVNGMMESLWGTGWFLRYRGKKDPTSLQDAVSCLKKLAQQLANETTSSQADAFSQTDAVSQSDAGNQTESSSKLDTDGHAAQVAPCTPPSRHRDQRAVSRSRTPPKKETGAASGSMLWQDQTCKQMPDVQDIAMVAYGKKLPVAPPAQGSPNVLGVSVWDEHSRKFGVTWQHFLRCRHLQPCEALLLLATAFKFNLACRKASQGSDILIFHVAIIFMACEMDGVDLTADEKSTFFCALKLHGKARLVKTAICQCVMELGCEQ